MDQTTSSPHTDDQTRRRFADDSGEVERFVTAEAAAARADTLGLGDNDGVGNNNENDISSDDRRGNVIGGEVAENPNAGPSFVSDQWHPSRHPQHRQQQQQQQRNKEPAFSGATSADAPATSTTGDRSSNPKSHNSQQQQHRHQHQNQYQQFDDYNYVRYKNEAAMFAMASTNSTMSSGSTPSTSYHSYHAYRSRYHTHQDGDDPLWHHYHNSSNHEDPSGYDIRPNLKNDKSDRYQTENDVQSNTNTNKNHNNKDLNSNGKIDEKTNMNNNNGEGNPELNTRGTQGDDLQRSDARFLLDRKPYVRNSPNGSRPAPTQRPKNRSLSPHQNESPFFDPTAAMAALQDRKPYVNEFRNGTNPRYAFMKQSSLQQGGSTSFDPAAEMAAIQHRNLYVNNFQTGRNHVQKPSASARLPELTAGTRSQGRLSDPSTATAAVHDRNVGTFRARPSHAPSPPPTYARQPRRMSEKRTHMPSPATGRPPASSTAPVAPSLPSPTLSRGGLSLARTIRYRRRRNLPPPLPKPPNAGSSSSGSGGGHPIQAVVVPAAPSADLDDDQQQLATVCIECGACGGMIDTIPKNAIALECPRCLAFVPTVTCKMIVTQP